MYSVLGFSFAFGLVGLKSSGTSD